MTETGGNSVGRKRALEPSSAGYYSDNHQPLFSHLVVADGYGPRKASEDGRRKKLRSNSRDTLDSVSDVSDAVQLHNHSLSSPLGTVGSPTHEDRYSLHEHSDGSAPASSVSRAVGVHTPEQHGSAAVEPHDTRALTPLYPAQRYPTPPSIQRSLTEKWFGCRSPSLAAGAQEELVKGNPSASISDGGAILRSNGLSRTRLSQTQPSGELSCPPAMEGLTSTDPYTKMPSRRPTTCGVKQPLASAEVSTPPRWVPVASSTRGSPFHDWLCNHQATAVMMTQYLTIFDLARLSMTSKDLAILVHRRRAPAARQTTSRLQESYLIYRSQVQAQARHPVPPNSFGIQTEVSQQMRSILVDWIVGLCLEYHHHIQTQFLAIRLLDRMLSVVPVPRNELQLLGTACLLVAAKVEETHYPDLRDLLVFCDNIYSRRQLIWMEQAVLKTLNFSLHAPTVMGFLKYLMVVGEIPSAAGSMCFYLSELSLLDAGLCQQEPSRVATAIMCISLYAFATPFVNILEVSGYSFDALRDVLSMVLNMQAAAPQMPLQIIRSAYSQPGHSFVGLLPAQFALLQFDPTAQVRDTFSRSVCGRKPPSVTNRSSKSGHTLGLSPSAKTPKSSVAGPPLQISSPPLNGASGGEGIPPLPLYISPPTLRQDKRLADIAVIPPRQAPA